MGARRCTRQRLPTRGARGTALGRARSRRRADAPSRPSSTRRGRCWHPSWVEVGVGCVCYVRAEGAMVGCACARCGAPAPAEPRPHFLPPPPPPRRGPRTRAHTRARARLALSFPARSSPLAPRAPPNRGHRALSLRGPAARAGHARARARVRTGDSAHMARARRRTGASPRGGVVGISEPSESTPREGWAPTHPARQRRGTPETTRGAPRGRARARVSPRDPRATHPARARARARPPHAPAARAPFAVRANVGYAPWRAADAM